MPRKRYLVTKQFQPTGAYKDTLSALSHEDTREILAEGTVPVELWEFDEGEAEEVRSRDHIVAVEEDVEDHALGQGEVTPSGAGGGGIYATDFDRLALHYHELEVAQQSGHSGVGTVVAVGDTGLKQAVKEKVFDYDGGTRLLASRSFVPGEEVEDGNGHGTFCCVAACPDNARLIVGKVLSNEGSGARSGIVSFIDWAVASGADVISLSLGGSGKSTAYDAVCRAAREQGVAVFAAAGNGGREDEPVNSPGNSDYALCVAASDPDTGKVADFSCKGPEVDFSGAGVDIQYEGENWSGTSMATPLVARTYDTILGVAKAPAVALKAMISTAQDSPGEPPTSEGVGVPKAARAAAVFAPELPVPYKPGVERVTLSRYQRGAYGREVVVTTKGKELAHSVPKP